MVSSKRSPRRRNRHGATRTYGELEPSFAAISDVAGNRADSAGAEEDCARGFGRGMDAERARLVGVSAGSLAKPAAGCARHRPHHLAMGSAKQADACALEIGGQEKVVPEGAPSLGEGAAREDHGVKLGQRLDGASWRSGHPRSTSTRAGRGRARSSPSGTRAG